MPGVANGVNKLLEEQSFKGEIHWNEWGRSWFPFDEMRETANEAAFIVKSMAEVHNKANYFAYWCLSDIYNQAGYGAETFHGNYGMLNLQGLKKPSYFAFELLGKMGDTVVPHSGKNTDRTTNAFVSKNENGFQILLYAYDNDYKVGDPSSFKEVKLLLPKGLRNADIALYEVNKSKNNTIEDWKTKGSPAYLKYGEKEEWRKKNKIQASKHKFEIQMDDDQNWLHFELESPGIALIDINLNS